MAAHGSINCESLVEWLHGTASNTYTQFGEDGLIQACLDRIGETNRHCFEIGAADGLFYSNTLRLREQGWKAVLIEAEAKAFQKLDETYGKQSVCIHGQITDLDKALSGTGISYTPDLGIIDIDGQDYWMWHDLQAFRPRVMLVEIFPRAAGEPIPKRGAHAGQAGLDAIRSLGESKEYTLVATTLCNALFIDSNELTA